MTVLAAYMRRSTQLDHHLISLDTPSHTLCTIIHTQPRTQNMNISFITTCAHSHRIHFQMQPKQASYKHAQYTKDT